MADVVAPTDFAAGIVQLVGFIASTEEPDESVSALEDVPGSFRDVEVRLPLKTSTLHRMRVQAENGWVVDEAFHASSTVIHSCVDEVQALMMTLEWAQSKRGFNLPKPIASSEKLCLW